MRWTGDTPLVAGDRIAFHSGGRVLQAVVVSPDESGGNGGVKMYRRWSGPLGSDSWIELI